MADIAATYFAAGAYLRLDKVIEAAAGDQSVRITSTHSRSTVRSTPSAMPSAVWRPPW